MIEPPNININVETDKVINQIHESKAIRRWTYAIGFIVIIGLFMMFGGDLCKGVADLIRAWNGR